MSVPDTIHLDDSIIFNMPFDITNHVNVELPVDDNDNISETIQFDSSTNTTRITNADHSVVQIQTTTTLMFRVIDPEAEADGAVDDHDHTYDNIGSTCLNNCPSQSKLDNTYDSIHLDILVSNELNASRQSGKSHDNTYDSVCLSSNDSHACLNRSQCQHHNLNSAPVNCASVVNTCNLDADGMHENENEEQSHISLRRISNMEAEQLQVRCRSLNPTIQPPDYAVLRQR